MQPADPLPGSGRPPIDTFLRSPADDAGERAIAVILSGTGTDGTRHHPEVTDMQRQPDTEARRGDRGAGPERGGGRPGSARHGRVGLAVFAVFAVFATLVAAGGRATAYGSETAWQEPVVVASGNAYRGPWVMNESVFDYVDDPTVAFTANGDVAIAWVDQAGKDVLFQRYGPDGGARLWRPVNVSATPEVFSWLPRLATAPGEPKTVYALWQEIVFSGGSHGGEIFFARSDDGGRHFSEPRNLSRTRAGAGKGRLNEDYWHNGSLDLAVGPDGTLYAAWTEYEGPLRVAVSTDGGGTFSEPSRIAGGAGELPARGPSLAAGADGVVHLAWTVGGDPAADIRYARSADGAAAFSEPRPVSPGPGHADGPKLAVDHGGTLHLVYANSREGPLGRYDILHAQYPAAAGGFGAPKRLSAGTPDGFAGAGFPYLATAAPGRVYVAFELFADNARTRPRGLALAWSRDGGRTFSAPALVPGSAAPAGAFNGSQQGLLMRKLDAAADGRIALVNSTFKDGHWSRVRLHLGRVAADTGSRAAAAPTATAPTASR